MNVLPIAQLGDAVLGGLSRLPSYLRPRDREWEMSGESKPEVPKEAEKLVSSKEDEMNDLKFFELTRAQIQHEDSLINNRMTWLIALQAFMFAAYGYSLGAQSSIENAQESLKTNLFNALPNATKTALAIDPVKFSAWFGQISSAGMSVIINARIVFAYMTFASSIVLLFGLVSAAGSMEKLARDWRFRRVTDRDKYPQIIGSSFFGMYGGLLPAYCLPLASSAVWFNLVEDEPLVRKGFYAVIAVAVCGVIALIVFHLGFYLGKQRRS